MHGGGALILLAAVACLPPAPSPGRSEATGLAELPPIHAQADLRDAGAPAIRGRLTGTCAGQVRVEVGSPNQARPLATVTTRPGPYMLFVPKDVALQLRWGCDPDGDGTLDADAIGEANLGELAQDLPLDLFVPDPARASGHALTVDVPFPTPTGRPSGGAPAEGGAPTAGMAPPNPRTAADAAVGPPLPDGPPADAGPPPPAGTPPPK